MKSIRFLIALFFLLALSNTYGQFFSCPGSKGEAIFTETFGKGTNFGPPLPPGITTYDFVNGTPDDGSYTLNYLTGLNVSWHNSLDHTPDATDGINGKSLIVNANENVSGEFYRRTVTGLCVNTRFEFSAWLMNVYNSSSSGCPNNEIPVNVRFEIWNETETDLLESGDTGDIFGTASAIWREYALVFTTGNETSVVLIMKNNGAGGCGNDLAIDDITFRSCGDLTTVSNPTYPDNIYTTCITPASVNLNAQTGGGGTYFYQWQSSPDNLNWTDIVGENNATITTPPVSSRTYYRTKIAQDIANINSPFCSTISNVFTVAISNGLPPAANNGNVEICSDQPIPALAVTTNPAYTVNWFDSATGGNLLFSESNTFTPPSAGTYFAESFESSSGCISTSRTPVTLTINQVPTATFTGNQDYCSGEMTALNLQSNVPGTTFSWTSVSTNVNGATSGTGNVIAQNLTTDGNTGTVEYIVTPQNNGCPGTPISTEIRINARPNPEIEDGSICLDNVGVFATLPHILDTQLSSLEHTFEWFLNGESIPGAIENTYEANQVGVYGVIATNVVSGCASELVTATVSEIPKPERLSITQSPEFSSSTFITIDVVGGQAPFLYQINNSGFQTSNTFNNLLSGIYEIEVTDSFNCSSLKTLVTIINFPKFFTPNGDGFNDTWSVLNLSSDATIKIFDRYGKLIIVLNSSDQSWDGTFNGQNLPSDDYWFAINFTVNGIPQEYRNHFSLKR